MRVCVLGGGGGGGGGGLNLKGYERALRDFFKLRTTVGKRCFTTNAVNCKWLYSKSVFIYKICTCIVILPVERHLKTLPGDIKYACVCVCMRTCVCVTVCVCVCV